MQMSFSAHIIIDSVVELCLMLIPFKFFSLKTNAFPFRIYPLNVNERERKVMLENVQNGLFKLD